MLPTPKSSKSSKENCIGADNVVSFVMLDNRMEKIDTYCGLQVPKAVMSNGPRLIVRFTGTHSSRHARGFRAKYAFVTRKKLLFEARSGA
ncbi:hypothetical protein O3M35_008735 [Rhynocoris fuscipes]|uniref:CUB domain-containing protein n=1 Tax=Rhynocoris fuscipes TaxID=488301 RepID=A0AAW1D784_9HEMI